MAGAHRFEDLLAWQRAHELEIEVWKASDRPPASRDFDFKGQIRDASESVARNVAEGFGRYSPPQFVTFLDVSRASALETKSLLKKGLAVGYWDEAEFRRLDRLATRAIQSIAKFQRYLRSPQARRNAERYRLKGQGPKNPNVPNVPNVPNETNDSNERNDPNETNDPNDPNDPNDQNDTNDPNGSNDPND